MNKKSRYKGGNWQGKMRIQWKSKAIVLRINKPEAGTEDYRNKVEKSRVSIKTAKRCEVLQQTEWATSYRFLVIIAD